MIVQLVLAVIVLAPAVSAQTPRAVLSVTPAILEFVWYGGTLPPAQTVTLTSTLATTWTARASTQTGANWLVVPSASSPAGNPRPNTSMLNAFDGQRVPNSAIVPTGTGGAIPVFTYRKTSVSLQVSGYFSR